MKKLKRGRPRIPRNAQAVRSMVSLSKEQDAHARKIGNGKLSRGVQILIDKDMAQPAN